MTASWHTLTPEALLSELCSNIATGLAESETRQRLQACGPNELPEGPLFRGRPRLLFTARNILTRPTPSAPRPTLVPGEHSFTVRVPRAKGSFRLPLCLRMRYSPVVPCS